MSRELATVVLILVVVGSLIFVFLWPRLVFRISAKGVSKPWTTLKQVLSKPRRGVKGDGWSLVEEPESGRYKLTKGDDTTVVLRPIVVIRQVNK